jgi:hypothetical protein
LQLGSSESGVSDAVTELNINQICQLIWNSADLVLATLAAIATRQQKPCGTGGYVTSYVVGPERQKRPLKHEATSSGFSQPPGEAPMVKSCENGSLKFNRLPKFFLKPQRLEQDSGNDPSQPPLADEETDSPVSTHGDKRTSSKRMSWFC